jgi:sn-glycerol 3-phosphate transport system substrate-binding protein
MLVTALLFSCAVLTASASPEGRRPVVFWHCFGGVIGEAVQGVIDGFNAAQDEIWVEGIFQGAYDDCLTKLKTDVPQGLGPDVWQMFELGTTFLVSSGYAIPFQEMLEKDSYIDIGNIEPALRRYYTYDGKMVCIPFNPSTPIMYYNKTAFEAAGITEPPTTFKEIAEIADKLTVKEGNRISRYAMGLSIYGWFFENFLAGMGANYVNNDNGRTGIATAIEFDTSGAGKHIFETWKQMVDDEVIYNYGVDNAAARAGFIAEQTCMTLESTAQLTGLIQAIDGKFELGTAYLPSMLDVSEKAVIIGGANLWLGKQDDEQRVLDAWEFIKYATSAPVSALFSTMTGYFCANTTAYDEPTFQAYLQANPNFLTAINQLHDCPDNYATNGASVGVMPELRVIFQDEMALLLEDVNDVDGAIAAMAAAGNAAIANYNATVYGN